MVGEASSVSAAAPSARIAARPRLGWSGVSCSQERRAALPARWGPLL